MPVLEFGYDGYSADRLLLGFRNGVDLGPATILARGKAKAIKARLAKDEVTALAVEAATDRLALEHTRPGSVRAGQGVRTHLDQPAFTPLRNETERPQRPARLTPLTIDLPSPRAGGYVAPVPMKLKRRFLGTEKNGSLLAGFPRGDPDRAPKGVDPDKQAPAATFRETARLRHQERYRWGPGRFFLGLIDGVETEDEGGRDTFLTGGTAIGVEDDRHICTIAGSRGGKGRSAIIPNILLYKGSVLATDPKGELATITARHRATLGEVHVLDPFGVAVGYPHAHRLITGFNPIEAMRAESLVEDAALIADALVVPGGQDPHWSDSARAFIEGLVLHVRTHPEYEDRRDLLTVRELAGEGIARGAGKTGMDRLAHEMRENGAAEGVIRLAGSDFADRPDGERGSVLSTVRRHLKFIDLFRETPLGRLTLEHPGFKLDDLKTRVMTIYLCLPARHIGTCGRWLRLFVNMTLQSMERTPSRDLPGKVPVLCALDEFASLGYLKQIEDSAAQIAGFGVKLWPVLQDLGQLKALYGERWETFLANSGIVQAFSNSDLTTLEWLSKRLGTTLVQMIGVNAPRNETPSQRAETSPSALYDLMTPEEIARFFGRNDPRFRQLVIWAGRANPFLVVQRAFYDKHEQFRRKEDDVPLFDTLPEA